MDLPLDGRVVVVVGAGSSGAGPSNGQAAALTCARAGAIVAAVDVDPVRAQEIAARIRAEGGCATGYGADVADETDVAGVVAAVTTGLGTPWVLHNHVGVVTPGPVVDLERATWDATVAVSLTGVFLTCRAVLPLMIAAGRGAVVNVSSVAAIRDTGYVYPAYSATKAAVNQLTVSLALTYARGTSRRRRCSSPRRRRVYANGVCLPVDGGLSARC